LTGPNFSLKNSWKNEWKQDSDLAKQTAESNLLVIISWLWSHALILCHGAIPFSTILPLLFIYYY